MSPAPTSPNGNLRSALGLALLSISAASYAPGAAAAIAPGTTTWKYTLPAAPAGSSTWKVSVGVYDKNGVLVRSLVRGLSLAPGLATGSWNGKNDAGVTMPTGATNPYTFRLAYHDISYGWEGVIGNTSASFDGAGVHSHMQAVNGLAISGGNAYLAAGYNEGQPGLSGFALASPQVAVRQFPSTDAFVAWSMVAADATNVYAANIGGAAKSSFVVGFNKSSSTAMSFSSGQSTCLNYISPGVCYPGQSYASVIDHYAASSDADNAAKGPTGIAVQQSGNVLAVAHGGLNLVRLFNKTTGASLGSISVTMSSNASRYNQLSMTAAGDLWVISGTQVIRYTNLSTAPSQAAVVSSGLVSPLALSAEGSSVDAGGVWVADGSTSQQLKHFASNGSAGSASGDTKGDAGGYSASPTVSDSKLCFKVAGGERTALAAESDGALWAVDTCNNRLLRYANGATSASTKVGYLPAFYASTVDHGNPSCVYANFLQFCNSGTRTDALVAGGAAWPLTKNWLASLPAELTSSSTENTGFNGFTTVETLSNSRTYGLLNVGSVQKLVELPSSGPVRLIGTLPQVAGATKTVMYENGDLGYAVTNTGTSTQTVYRLALSGFTGSGDPQWGAAVSQAVVPTTASSPHSRAGVFTGTVGPRFPLTASNRVVFFDQSITGTNLHLGAATRYDTKWLWQASPSGLMDGKGAFQTKALDASVSYGGSLVWATGSHIVYGYQGTNFKDPLNAKLGYASQFMHFDENGLFLGQFGEATTRSTRPAGSSLPVDPLSPTLVQEPSSGPLFLYSSDEAGHGGIHRFRFNGLSTLVYKTGTVSVGGTVTLN